MNVYTVHLTAKNPAPVTEHSCPSCRYVDKKDTNAKIVSVTGNTATEAAQKAEQANPEFNIHAVNVAYKEVI